MTISKVNNIAYASVAKFKSVTKANLGKMKNVSKPTSVILSDFTAGSTPTGWITPDLSGVSGYAVEFSWADPNANSSGNYFWLRGDAGNGRTHYPLRYSTAFQGDYLFQLSFHTGDITCRDWGMAVSPNNASSTSDSHWKWVWNYDPSRIAVQNNCGTPTIYTDVVSPSNATVGGGANINSPAGWYTSHMYHKPSTGTTELKVTEGQDDWDLSGTQQGGTASIARTIVSNTTTDYWFGIGGDWDVTADSVMWAKSSGARISPIT